MKTCGRVGVKIYKATPEFWASYRNLPREIQQLADKSFELLKRDPRHPALHFKKVGNRWSARISKDYRALAREEDGLLVWIWIGKHDAYMRRIRSAF